MTVSRMHDQMVKVHISFHETLKQPLLLKVQSVVFEALNIFISSIAGVLGFTAGFTGGALLVVAGTVVGVGSLALHLLNLYGMCVKDGTEGAYSTCYAFLNRYKPEAQ